MNSKLYLSLKAPTPSIGAIIEDAQHHCLKTDLTGNASTTSTSGDSTSTGNVRNCVKAGKISVTAKPHGVRTSFSPLGSGKMVSSQNQRKSLSSPEPMSIGGDSERSRSPSPVEAGVEHSVTADQLPVPVVQLPRYSY